METFDLTNEHLALAPHVVAVGKMIHYKFKTHSEHRCRVEYQLAIDVDGVTEKIGDPRDSDLWVAMASLLGWSVPSAVGSWAEFKDAVEQISLRAVLLLRDMRTVSEIVMHHAGQDVQLGTYILDGLRWIHLCGQDVAGAEPGPGRLLEAAILGHKVFAIRAILQDAVREPLILNDLAWGSRMTSRPDGAGKVFVVETNADGSIYWFTTFGEQREGLDTNRRRIEPGEAGIDLHGRVYGASEVLNAFATFHRTTGDGDATES